MGQVQSEYLPVRGEAENQIGFTRVPVDKMDAVDREYVAQKLELKTATHGLTKQQAEKHHIEIIQAYLTKKEAQQ